MTIDIRDHSSLGAAIRRGDSAKLAVRAEAFCSKL
jgi:hypothetical protein